MHEKRRNITGSILSYISEKGVCTTQEIYRITGATTRSLKGATRGILSTLVRRGRIQRIGKGIYTVNRCTESRGGVPPEPQEQKHLEERIAALESRIRELEKALEGEASELRTVKEQLDELLTGRAQVQVLSGEEAACLRELFSAGHLWDDELDRSTREILRRLEKLKLVRSSVAASDGTRRAFWELTDRGVSAVLHEGGA